MKDQQHLTARQENFCGGRLAVPFRLFEGRKGWGAPALENPQSSR